MGGYVTMVVAIFLIVFAASSLQSQSSTCNGPLSDLRYCSDTATPKQTPAAATLTGNFTATIQACKNIAESAAKTHDFHPVDIIWRGGSTKDEARIDQGTDVPYLEKRINVPVVNSFFEPDKDEKHSQTDDNIEIDGKKYEVFYPMKSGELLGLDGEYTSESRCDPRQDNEDRYCEGRHRIYFIDYQLVFLRHLNADGTPVIVPGTETAKYPYNIMDVYQSTESINNPKVGKLPEEAFDCSKIGQTATAATQSTAPPIPAKTSVYIPRQQISAGSNQLQLEWFLFGQTTGGAETPISQPVPQLAFQIGCKPAVYLYPPQKQLVNVKVYPKGFLTYTDPLYDLKNGWTVEANPDGKLSTTYNLQPSYYPYLYYESKIHDQYVQKPEKGWVVQSSAFSRQPSEWFEPLEEKFNDLLPKLGLNEQQTKDFIEYWKKALPYSPYYFIGVMDQDNVNQFEPLEITPKPDVINRVRIYFEKLDQPKTVESPQLSLPDHWPLATGHFSVVEWGGMVKNDLNHPFTCSQ